jgi:hypothetical protein
MFGNVKRDKMEPVGFYTVYRPGFDQKIGGKLGFDHQKGGQIYSNWRTGGFDQSKME